MARLYSELLYYAHDITTGTWTVPDDQVWIVREVAVFCPAPVAGGFGQLIDTTSRATYWYSAFSPSIDAVYVADKDRRLVLPAGFTTEVEMDAGLGAGVDV